MGMALKILYRGTLASCNYACSYCPFAKRQDTRTQLAQDKAELERFVAWAIAYPQPLAVLFTPWGEALIRRHYQHALHTLSHAPLLEKVAIQTNLSAPLTWLRDCNAQTLALWCTFHPSQISLTRFLAKCDWLLQHGIRFSVGMVGNRAELPIAECLRAQLPPHIYLWINANRDEQAAYTASDLTRWTAIDPLFPDNLHLYPSRGKTCYAGTQVLSVAGDGTVQRCHFVKPSLGNLYSGYTPDAAPCPNTTCDCHIGYIHLPELDLYRVYGTGLLERVPAGYLVDHV